MALVDPANGCYSLSMRATTIKVEGELLEELERAKPAAQSLSAFIRSVLRRELVRRKLGDAAERYAEFLHSCEDERKWLEEWDRADLVRPPKRKRR